jgi:hypothetical protein
LFLPWADAAKYANNTFFRSDGNKLVAATGIFAGHTQIGALLGTTSIDFSGSGSDKIRFRLHNGGNNGFVSFNEGDLTIAHGRAGARVGSISNLSGSGGFAARNVYTNLGGSDLYIGSRIQVGPTDNTVLTAGESDNGNAGNVIIRGANSIFTSGTPSTKSTGDVLIQLYADTNSVTIPNSLVEMMRFRASGNVTNRTNWEVYRLNATASGIRTLTMESDTVKYRIENIGTISTSTDASGDITVAHGMGVTPTSVQVTVTGTTPYVVTVHTIDATNFTVRFFDMTGAAVASTAVTATWHCKT